MPDTMLCSESTMMKKINIIHIFMTSFFKQKRVYSYLSNWKKKVLITEHIELKKDNLQSKMWLVQPHNKMFM